MIHKCKGFCTKTIMKGMARHTLVVIISFKASMFAGKLFAVTFFRRQGRHGGHVVRKYSTDLNTVKVKILHLHSKIGVEMTVVSA